MRIIAHDESGNRLSSTLPHENLWIEVEKEGGEKVYVGSLFFQEMPDGSLAVEWGSSRNENEWWERTVAVTVPADELTETIPTEGATQ